MINSLWKESTKTSTQHCIFLHTLIYGSNFREDELDLQKLYEGLA